MLTEKLTFPHLPACYGTRKFITAFTTAHRLSLSWARSIQYKPSHRIFWRFIWILSSPPKDLSRSEAVYHISLHVKLLQLGDVSSSLNPQDGGPPIFGYPLLIIQHIRSYPPYLEAFPPSPPWGHVMPCWHGSTYLGLKYLICVCLVLTYCAFYALWHKTSYFLLHISFVPFFFRCPTVRISMARGISIHGKGLITKATVILKMYHRCFIWPETDSNKVMTRLSYDLSQINNTQ
jgi:hypothetical protein